MKLKDGLAQYYSTHPFLPIRVYEQKKLNKQFKSDLKALGEQTPGYAVLWFLINRYDMQFHPDSAIEVCNLLGCETYEDLNNWAGAWQVTNIKKALDLNSRTLDLSDLTKISISGLRSRINTISNLADTVDIVYADSEYQVLPDSEIEYLFETFQGHKYEYIPDSCDCDDFTRILRGWLSEQNLGNLTVGKCWYKGYNQANEVTVYHSVVAIITDQNIYCAEPQKEMKFWPIEEPSGMFWSKNIVRTEITKLGF